MPRPLDDLVRAFSDHSLPMAEWTHQAHLATGTWYASRFTRAEALDRLRIGIRTYNVAQGGANTDTSGYHETITRAWVELLAQWCELHPDLSTDERVVKLLASPLAAPDVLLRFYSRERLFSTEARAAWVEPDLAPLHLAALGIGPGTG